MGWGGGYIRGLAAVGGRGVVFQNGLGLTIKTT